MFKLCCDVLSVLHGAPVKLFTLQDTEDALLACIGKTDDELMVYQNFSNAEGPHVVVPKLSLLCAIMRATQIRTVITVDVIGSCAGVLSGKIAGLDFDC